MTTAIYLKEAKYSLLERLRIPAFLFSSLGFPLMFYVLFGLALPTGQASGLHMATYLLATYGTFGVMGVCLFGFGVSVAIERQLGWLELKRASPMPPAAYFVAKLATCVVFSLAVVTLLLALGFAFGHVQLSPLDTLRLIAILVAGAIPFGALGVALGYFANASSAPSFLNMIYLPMSFCSGLWIPLQFLPKILRQIAPFLPPYHLSRLALGVIGADQPNAYWCHWAALAGFTLLFVGVAALAYRLDASRKNGIS